jgi:hypothetical protein
MSGLTSAAKDVRRGRGASSDHNRDAGQHAFEREGGRLGCKFLGASGRESAQTPAMRGQLKPIADVLDNARLQSIPTGLRHPTQGCEEIARNELPWGTVRKWIQPQRGCGQNWSSRRSRHRSWWFHKIRGEASGGCGRRSAARPCSTFCCRKILWRADESGRNSIAQLSFLLAHFPSLPLAF